MKIDGPMAFTLLTDINTQSHSLKVTFKDTFRARPLAERIEQFNGFVEKLQAESVNEPADSDQARGMALVLTFARQLAPYIAQDEVPIDEAIIVDIEQEQQKGIIGLIRSLN